VTPLWNRRVIVHGEVCGSSSHFRHTGYGECRTVVKDGGVVDAERFAEILKTSDVKELTPPSRLSAMFRYDPVRDAKPNKRTPAVPRVEGEKIAKPPIEEIVLDVLDSAEHYTRVEEIVRKEYRSTDDFEEAQILPWEELKAA